LSGHITRASFARMATRGGSQKRPPVKSKRVGEGFRKKADKALVAGLGPVASKKKTVWGGE